MNRAERRRRARQRGRRAGYLARVVALGRTLAQSRGPGVVHVLVRHAPACPRPNGGACSCEPELELTAGPGLQN